jgi:hypothetical protein
MRNKLIIPEEPLLILPTLAKEIGLNEAIVLQQLHYWLQKSNHTYEGKRWIYNSYEAWQKQFPFWSISTIKRTIQNLEKRELVLSAILNKDKMNKTKWYSINYEKIPSLYQNDPTIGSTCTDDRLNLTPSIYNTETTTENTNIYNNIYTIFDFWNEQGIIVHRSIDKFKSAINSALKSYSLDEIKEAILNYKEILSSSEYWWNYKWTLKEFLQRGLDKFLTVNKPFENFRRKPAESSFCYWQPFSEKDLE